MLSTITGLMVITTVVNGVRVGRLWSAYQEGKVPRGQMVNQATTEVLMVVGSGGLVVLNFFVP